MIIRAVGLIALFTIACGGASAPGPVASSLGPPTAAPTGTPAPLAPTPVSTPPPMTVAPAATLISPPAGQAIYEGTVVVDGTNTPIAAAKIELAPFGISTTTDASGRFWFDSLPINGRCRWVTITVTASGFGMLRRIDEPFMPSHLIATLFLGRTDSVRYVGPSLAAYSPGPDYCTR